MKMIKRKMKSKSMIVTAAGPNLNPALSLNLVHNPNPTLALSLPSPLAGFTLTVSPISLP
jgi:hypothetical protein